MVPVLSRPHPRLFKSYPPMPTTLRPTSDAKPSAHSDSHSKHPLQPLSVLRRPWRRVRRPRWTDCVFVLAKRNYKVHAVIRPTRRQTPLFEAILDTGAGSSLIRKDALPEKIWCLIRPIREGVRIKDAGNRNVRIAGKITLIVILDHRVETI